MLNIILDKGLPTEIVIPIDSYKEMVLMNTINAQKKIELNQYELIPTIQNEHFNKLNIELDGINIPFVNHYNKVLNFNIGVDDVNKDLIYDINIGIETLLAEE